MDIPGDMDIGVAAGPMSLAAAGEPPVFSIRLGLIIQPDLETMDIAVPGAARHQTPRMAEDVPVYPVNIEARDALQIVKVGKDARQKTPGGAGRAECGTCFAQYAPHSIPEPKDRLCAWGRAPGA